MRFRLLLAVALASAAARASNVSDQLSVNNTQATTTNPRSGNVSDNLSASFDLAENVSLDLGATLTAESATPAAARGQFGTSGSVLTLFSAGLDWDVTDNWSLAFDADVSPTSTQEVGTDISVVDATGRTLNGQALIDSQSSQYDGGFDLSYDTAGESNLEWYLSAGVTGTHVATNQAVTRAHIGTLSFAQIKSLCAAHPGSKVCQAINTQTAVTLDSEKFSLAATATAWRGTDLTLSGDVYHYEQDPKSVLYPSLVAAHLGMGMTIAPLAYLARAEILQRFGDFSAKLWVQGGQYEAGTADSTKGIGVKLQYKFTKSFKTWITASGQSDITEPDATTPGQTIKSSTIALGAQYRF
jgi:hypothetical protein